MNVLRRISIISVWVSWLQGSYSIQLKHVDDVGNLLKAIQDDQVDTSIFVRELIPSVLPYENGAPKLSQGTEEISSLQKCSVGKNTTIEVMLRPSSIMDTETFRGIIEKDTFRVIYPDGSLYKQYYIPSIQILVFPMPIETLSRTRECFRFYYKTAPHGFCAHGVAERNSWINALTEAVFCLNTKHQVKPMKLDVGEVITLNPVSTKNERWTKMLNDVKQQAEKKKEKSFEIKDEDKNKTNEVEILNLLEGKPKVLVNGEHIPLFLEKKEDMDTLIKQEEMQNATIETFF